MSDLNEPIGDQPLATELYDLPSLTALGIEGLPYVPIKLSLLESNPSTDVLTAWMA